MELKIHSQYVPGVGMCMFEGRHMATVVKILDGRNRDVVPIAKAYLQYVLGVPSGFLSDPWEAMVVLASQFHRNGTEADDAYVEDLIYDAVQNYAPVRLAPSL